MNQIHNELQIEQDGFTYILHKANKTADILHCNSSNCHVIIQRSINYENQEYNITSILSKSFQYSNIVSINFSSDTVIETVEKGAFANSSLEIFTIPSSVVELKEGWCKKTPRMRKVEVNEGNKRYKNYNDDLIIGKNQIESVEFDELIFVNREMRSITIPPFIKRILSYSISNSLIESILIPSKITQISNRAFYNCFFLKEIEFEKNSELQIIGEKVFKNSRVKRIEVPQSVTEIQKSSFIKLTEVQIMEGNENFKNYEKYVIEKTDKNSDTFDALSFVPRKEHRMKIPSFIKQIGPFSFYFSSIENIVIPSSITCICRQAFFLSHLKKIEFQKNSQLQRIEERAFTGSLIERIDIPQHVVFIGKFAFRSCIYLQKVEFEQNSELQTIENKLFQSTKIRSIKIPKHVKKIGKYAFNDCNKLEQVEFTNDSELEIIEEGAFGNTIIKQLKIPSSVVELKENWCSWTPDLNKVEISEGNIRYKNYKNDFVIGKTSIESKEYNDLVFVNRNVQKINIPSYITKISAYSFSNSLIEHINIPAKLKEIGDFAFRKCEKLRQIQFDKNSELQTIGQNAFEFSSIETIIIPPHVTRICNGTFRSCYKLRKVTFSNNSERQAIEASVFGDSNVEALQLPSNIVLEKGCFSDSDNLKKITIFPNNNQENIVYYEDCMILGKSDIKSDNFDVLIFVRRDVENITIPSFITRIASYAFQGCKLLQSVNFADISQIKNIEENAFSYSSLKSFTIPPNVTQISRDLFYNCEEIQHIEFPENCQLKTIEKFAFSDTTIQEIKIPSHVTLIGQSSFQSCEKLKNVFFPADSELYSILDSAFYLTSIETIIIPSSVTYICKSAFGSCRNLRHVEFSENSKLKMIGINAFYNSSIETIKIPKHVIYICEGAFYKCNHLEKVEFEENSELRIIEKNAFEESSIKRIMIPSKTNVICSDLFKNCKCLQFVEFEDNSMLQTIEKRAFANTSIERIKIPRLVKEICRETFLNCEQLKQIEFDENSELKKISIFAFKSCRNICIKIPQQVTEITNASFQYCSQIVVEIDENSKLESISNDIFADSLYAVVFIPPHLKNIIS